MGSGGNAGKRLIQNSRNLSREKEEAKTVSVSDTFNIKVLVPANSTIEKETVRLADMALSDAEKEIGNVLGTTDANAIANAVSAWNMTDFGSSIFSKVWDMSRQIMAGKDPTIGARTSKATLQRLQKRMLSLMHSNAENTISMGTNGLTRQYINYFHENDYVYNKIYDAVKTALKTKK